MLSCGTGITNFTGLTSVSLKWYVRRCYHFGLAFQCQIKKYVKKNGKNQLQIKNTI